MLKLLGHLVIINDIDIFLVIMWPWTVDTQLSLPILDKQTKKETSKRLKTSQIVMFFYFTIYPLKKILSNKIYKKAKSESVEINNGSESSAIWWYNYLADLGGYNDWTGCVNDEKSCFLPTLLWSEIQHSFKQ